MMQRQLVVQRLSIVDDTSGSIVGAATWCSLHAHDAAIIVSVLCDRIADVSVPSRASLLFVLHEMLLSCAAGATGDAGKRATVNAVASLLPPTLRRAFSVEGVDHSDLRNALSQVIHWWETLRVFSSAWLEDVAALGVHAMSPSQSGTNDGQQEDHRDAELAAVTKLLVVYRAAKDTMNALKAEGASPSAIESAKEDAVTCLNAAIKALNEVSTRLSVHEMAELSSSSAAGALHAPPPSSSVASAEQDDVLGSFF
ncbi:Hypothetical protein, putative [Bodo saltans]|uniref:CID domain-containing protein n=1 Tax=Bodo saltans TaxID=75058 RepID=A0A0S4IY70_BODSA|nr:Hypothetical protein, putative [Bodo saltans]|eukprot:CUF96540.1 Hypothetical protein, putative [Bodo saltans]